MSFHHYLSAMIVYKTQTSFEITYQLDSVNRCLIDVTEFSLVDTDCKIYHTLTPVLLSSLSISESP